MPYPLIVIAGPTSSGKSDFALQLAKEYTHAVIIGADSSQVYRRLDLSSGKVAGTWVDNRFWVDEIEHGLIDCISLQNSYDVRAYLKDCYRFIHSLASRGYPPDTIVIVTGGTMYYIQALLEGWEFDDSEQIIDQSGSLYEVRGRYFSDALTGRARLISYQSLFNPRRIRSAYYEHRMRGLSPLLDLTGLYWLDCSSDVVLKKRIADRIHTRIQAGMLEECEQLITDYSPVVQQKNLECRWWDLVSKGMLEYPAGISVLESMTWKYARKQKDWLKKLSELSVVYGLQLQRMYTDQ